MARRALTVLVAALLAQGSLPVPAWPEGKPVPSPPEPIVQVGLDLIRFDTSVTDQAGRAVSDLGAADFVVEIDGKKQPVRSATLVGGENGPAPSPGASAAADRSLIFMVDDLDAPYASLFLAKDALRSFVGRWNPAEEQVAIRLTSDKQGKVTLSRSPERFAEAIDGIHFKTLSAKEALSPPPVMTQAFPRPVDLDLSPMKVEAMVVEGEGLKVDTSPIPLPPALPIDNFQQRLYCLLSTIQAMKSLPGRKALVFVGDDLLSKRDTRMSEVGVSTPFDSLIDASPIDSVLRTIAEVANRASVVIYIIEPNGLAKDATVAGAGPVPPASPRSEVPGSRLLGPDALQRLAHDTGGITIVNYNGLRSGLEQIVTDQRSYYVVAFEPPKSAFTKTSGKAKFHAIKLMVKRPDVAVRTRSGFYGVTDQEVGARPD